MTTDFQRVEAFAGQIVGAVMGAATTAMIVVGDELGLYRAMAEKGPVTAATLAAVTGTHERYVAEWLAQQAAAGCVEYDAGTDASPGTFTLPPEHAAVLADEESPASLTGAALLPLGMFRDVHKLVDAFRTGQGIAWSEHDPAVFAATERFWATAYRACLTSEWIPSLDGVEDKLRSGTAVADIGCGHGTATLLMAEAYPASRFAGYDSHAESIAVARERAAEAGVADRVRFEVADARAYPAQGYDLVCFFDTLHDLGDPVGAAAYARKALAPDGALLLVEPRANDDFAANLAELGAPLNYAASAFLCTPNSLAQDVGLALGGQAGERRIRAVAEEAGFTRFRRAADSMLNSVYEVRP